MPNESALAPGSAWKKGFFSTGSSCRPATYPNGTLSVPASLKRTRQMPSRPGGITQRWPQAKQRTRPFSSRS